MGMLHKVPEALKKKKKIVFMISHPELTFHHIS